MWVSLFLINLFQSFGSKWDLKFLSLGFTSNYNFGKFDYESFDLYQGVNYGIYSNSSSEISGFNYQLSSNIDIPINRDLKFNIMLSYSPSSILNSTNTKFLYTSTTNLIKIILFINKF